MVKLGLLVRLEAKPGMESEVARFLEGALPLAREEAGTQSWFALRLGPASFGIFDTFADEAARQAHIDGRIADLLRARSRELLAEPPRIERVELIAVKQPHG